MANTPDVALPPSEVEGATQGVTAIALTDAEVAAVAQAASARWANSGLTDAQSQALASVNYIVQDLGGAQLGATEGNTIFLDINAAGFGWFVDSTPLEDSEFSGGTLRALGGSAASQVDLLTTILHEQGHILGLEEIDASGHLMSQFLSYGERRLPEAGLANGVEIGSLEGTHHLTFGPTVEDFAGEALNQTTFSTPPGGPVFTVTDDFKVDTDPFFNGGSYLGSGYLDGISTGIVGSIKAPTGTSFILNSFDVGVSNDDGNSFTTSGNLIFRGTPANGDPALVRTITITSTGSAQSQNGVTLADGTGDDFSGVYLSKLEIEIAGGAPINYVALDNLNYTAEVTAPPVPTTSSYSAAVLADNPLAFWQFNEGSGTSQTDSTGNGNTGASVGTPDLRRRPLGQAGDFALDFTPGNYVNITTALTAFDSIVTNDQVTVEFWVFGDPAANPTNTTFNLTNGGGNRVAFVHLPWDDSNVYWDACYRRGAGSRVNTLVASNDYEGKWTHYAFVKNGTTNFSGIYIDGEPRQIHHGFHRRLRNPDILRIAENFDGMLDDVAIYNTALTQTQIRAHIDAASRMPSMTPPSFPTPPTPPTKTPPSASLPAASSKPRPRRHRHPVLHRLRRHRLPLPSMATPTETGPEFDHRHRRRKLRLVAGRTRPGKRDQPDRPLQPHRLLRQTASPSSASPSSTATPQPVAPKSTSKISPAPQAPADPVTLPSGVTGTHVRIAIDPASATGQPGMDGNGNNVDGTILSLAEVQIFGSAVPTGDGLLANDILVTGEPDVQLFVQGSLVGQSSTTVTTNLGGEVTVRPDGSFSYDPSGSQTLDSLGAGDTAVDTFTYSIFSSSGTPTVNLALASNGGVATQSSTRAAGGAASRAIDGNTNGSFGGNSVTHTDQATPFTWWQVELAVHSAIDEIVLFNRTRLLRKPPLPVPRLRFRRRPRRRRHRGLRLRLPRPGRQQLHHRRQRHPARRRRQLRPRRHRPRLRRRRSRHEWRWPQRRWKRPLSRRSPGLRHPFSPSTVAPLALWLDAGDIDGDGARRHPHRRLRRQHLGRQIRQRPPRHPLRTGPGTIPATSPLPSRATASPPSSSTATTSSSPTTTSTTSGPTTPSSPSPATPEPRA